MRSRSQETPIASFKKSRKEPIEGDVFVLSLIEGIFFYGKVLKTHIPHIKRDIFINDKNVIFIFKSRSKYKRLDDFTPNYCDLLIRPAIVDKSYWARGYFETIGNEPLSEAEQQLDYGFYDSLRGNYTREDGTILEHAPKIIGGYGITTIIGIAMQVKQEMLFDPSLSCVE